MFSETRVKFKYSRLTPFVEVHMSELEALPISPITGNNSVRIVDTYLVADIVKIYREQENINVERYFQHGDILYLLECLDTGYRFYFPYETAGDPEFYRDLLRAVEEKGVDYDRDWDKDHRFGFSHITRDDNVLEIGCNSGKFLKRVSEITENVVGLDFNPLALEKASARGVTAINESIEVHSERHAGEYDIVFAFQVFEHLTQIGSVVTAILRALKPGGKLIMSVPNCEPFAQRFNKYEVLNLPPHHVGLWNLGAFEKLAEHFNMSLAAHHYYDTRGILPDAYLRSKLMTDVRSIPTRHSIFDKLKMLAVSPITVSLSTFDYLIKGVRNHTYISVVFQKQ